MSISAKPDDPRSPRGQTLPKAPPVSRRGFQHRPARSTGAGTRRAPKPAAVSPVVGAQIIYLSWADTFGRPARSRLPGMTARVLPFRGR